MSGQLWIAVLATTTAWEHFYPSPLLFTARCMLAIKMLLCMAISGAISMNSKDLFSLYLRYHNVHRSLPSLLPGDILVHAGGQTEFRTCAELLNVLNWLSAQSYPFKIFIAGPCVIGLL